MQVCVDRDGRDRVVSPSTKHKGTTPLKATQRGGAFEVTQKEEEPLYQHIGFPLTKDFYFMNDEETTLPVGHEIPASFTVSKKFYTHRLNVRITFPIYPVFVPRAEATFKRIWEIRVEPSTEVDDEERDAMRAHYDRVAPKKVVEYPDVPAECDRPDPYNFYQRTRMNDGYKVVPRVYGDDFKRMFKDEHYKGNPQHQTEFDFGEFETKDGEVDFLGVGPESQGANKNEKAYWIGQVYIMNLRNGKRKSGWLIQKVATYFNVGLSTVQRNAKFADACNTLSEDGDGSKMANTVRKRAVKAAQIMSEEEFDWVLKPYPYGKRSKPWMSFDGERGYDAKEMALRI